MITTCTGCQTRYRLDDGRVPRRRIRVRCPRCEAVFALDGTQAAAQVAPVEDGLVIERSGGGLFGAPPTPAAAETARPAPRPVTRPQPSPTHAPVAAPAGAFATARATTATVDGGGRAGGSAAAGRGGRGSRRSGRPAAPRSRQGPSPGARPRLRYPGL